MSITRSELIEKLFKEMIYNFRSFRPDHHGSAQKERFGEKIHTKLKEHEVFENWRDHRMSHSHFDLLFRLGKEKDGISVKDIAEGLHITSGAVTQMVDGLVTIGLLTREEDPNDRRSQIIKLSAKARDKAEWFRKHFTDKIEPRFSNLTDKEVTQLTKLLGKIKKSEEKISEDKNGE